MTSADKMAAPMRVRSGLVLIYIMVVFHIDPAALSVFSPRVVETRLLWEPGVPSHVSVYRIPVVTRLPNGSLIAFAEARRDSSSDAGPKFLAMRVSRPDVKKTGDSAGDVWTSNRFIVDDDNATKDGLNLGAVVVDEIKNALIVLYSECAHTECPSRDYMRGNYMKRSSDWGLTWGPSVDISAADPSLTNMSWSAGPGYGIQKKYAPYKGRLIACGHSNDFSVLKMLCIVSDDHGDTWRRAGEVLHVPYREVFKRGDFAPTEVQMVELYNGTIIFNVRNEGQFRCSCRLVMASYDGAETIPIETIRTDPTLVDPVCAGSILLQDHLMYFTNPASALSRVNLTLRWSPDFGESWNGSLVLNPGSSGYSCLTSIDDNHIGVVYEQGLAGVWFLKIRLYI